MKISLISIFILAFTISANADILYLNNGRKLEGLIKNENEDSLELEVSAGVVKFQKSEIKAIEKSSYEESVAIRQKWENQKSANQKRLSKQRMEEERRPKGVVFSAGGQSITVTAKLNHKVNATLLLDTGASLVVLKKYVAEALGMDLSNVNPDAKMTVADGRVINAKYIVLQSVKVENVEAENVETAVILDETGPASFGDGLLGMSFLKRFNFKIDHKQNKLILEKLY